MDFIYKDDWQQAQERLLAFWQGEIIDRVAIKVTAPKGDRRYVQPPPDIEGLWTDPDFLVDNTDAAMACTYWGGERIPGAFVNLGPSIIGAYLGCPLHHDRRTGWQDPIVHDPADWSAVTFDPSNRWWRMTKQITQALVEAGEGKYFVGITDLGDASDVMSYVRTPDELCMDLLDIPEPLYAVRDKLVDLWFRLYDELYSIVQTKMTGSSSWLQVWSPGRTYTLQSDFSCMISAAAYREFVLPEVLAQTKWLDHTIYHLDGPGAIQHLDTLLDVPELGGIQWVPGAGAPPEKDWPDLLKRIQSAGKRLHIHVDKNDIEGLLEVISPKGLIIDTHCDSEQEARDLLKKAETWTAHAARQGRA